MDEDGSMFFPPTHWSLVARAAHRADGNDALDALLRQYLGPMKRHLKEHWRADPETVDELLQTFITEKILQQQILATADAARGRFRAFLVTVLNRFASNYFRDERRLKRGAGQVLPLDESPPPAASGPHPATAFDLEWAREVLHQAIERMKAECDSAGRPDLWGVFEARVLRPTLHHHPVVPYEELIARFSLESPEQASNVLMTAKRTFTRCLRSVIGQYERDAAEIDQELMDLRKILSRDAGRRATPQV